MKITNIENAAKKKKSKPGKVVDIEKYVKKNEVQAEKIKKLQNVGTIARKTGINTRNVNQTDLIRAIQSAEGNNACFATSSEKTCGQMNCLWRALSGRQRHT